MDLWQGTCYIHVEFTARSINKIREEYPDAPVVAHPECTYAVRMLADEVCSTEKMVTLLQGIAGARDHRRDRSRACCIDCTKKFRAKHSFLARPTIAFAASAAS